MKKLAIISLVACCWPVTPARTADSSPDGWHVFAPRDEIRPAFSFEPSGGPKHAGSLVVVHDHRDGLDGWFQKSENISCLLLA